MSYKTRELLEYANILPKDTEMIIELQVSEDNFIRINVDDIYVDNYSSAENKLIISSGDISDKLLNSKKTNL